MKTTRIARDLKPLAPWTTYPLAPFVRDLVFAPREDGLRIGAVDEAGEARAIEIPGHPYFVATLFQPERRALAGALHPLVGAFIQQARRR